MTSIPKKYVHQNPSVKKLLEHAGTDLSNSLTVDPGQAPTRLDIFLAFRTGMSRSRVKAWIEEANVVVNNAPARASYLVRPNDEVFWVPFLPPAPELIPEDIPLNVLYEDETIIAINKPAGIVVHPAQSIRSGTVVNALLWHVSKTQEELSPGLPGGDTEGLRPGIIHRLDKDTSGILLAAKSLQAQQILAKAFSDRTVHKTYIALVWGDLNKKTGRIDAPIGRHLYERALFAVVPDGKAAVTNWEVVERFGLWTLVHCFPETGRTHQIRVHFAHIGHPVFGDPLYGGRNRQLARLTSAQRNLSAKALQLCNGQFLHAHRLDVPHPSRGGRLDLIAPLPDNLEQILTLFRSNIEV
ncbi:MAG: RluA family pseudouridine synthase [bacterium]|nr:RluA family pseudouridine synthase [bacterium]